MLARSSPSTRKSRLLPVLMAASPIPTVSAVYQRPSRVNFRVRRHAGVARRGRPATRADNVIS